LTGITEEYLRFARLPKPQLQRADANDIVRELLEFVRPELDSAGVKVSLSLSPGLPRVLADVAQLRQLLLNLLRNAREAMSGGGSLRVTTRATKATVEIEVRDSGPGISAERLARIFDPFFTTKERGTGLGLAMAQEIAQEHGGQLVCDSEGYPDGRTMNALVEDCGGSLNGVTTRDHGYYFSPVHPERLETPIAVLGDMLARPLFKEIELEREVILEEILDEVDEKGR